MIFQIIANEEKNFLEILSIENANVLPMYKVNDLFVQLKYLHNLKEFKFQLVTREMRDGPKNKVNYMEFFKEKDKDLI